MPRNPIRASGRRQLIRKDYVIRFCRSNLRRGTIMSGKAIAVKKYVVKLSEDERNQLGAGGN